MNKKFFKGISLLLSIFVFSLAGCNNNNNTSSSGNENLNNSNNNSSNVHKEHGITFYGVEDITIDIYQDFDLLEGVRAVDGIDGELEVEIVDDDGFVNDFVYTYTIIYKATNSVGDSKEVERSIAVRKGVNVENGNFAYGKHQWTFDKPGGSGSVSYKNGQANIKVENAGSEAWSLQLYQMGIAFEKGRTYELSFDAKSVSGRSISAGFENVGKNYSMMTPGYQAITLQAGADFAKYSIYCTPSEDVSNVKVVVYVGRNLDIDMTASKDHPLDLVLDNINVKEITVDPSITFENAESVSVKTKDEFDAKPAVKAFDKNGNDISNNIQIVGEVPVSVSANTGMLVSYRVHDSEGNFNFVNRRIGYTIAKDNPWNLINENFDNGTQGWIQDVNQTNGSGEANFAVNNGVMEANITNGSSTGWHIQLHQSNITLTGGHIYRMTLVAKASVERNVTLEISDPSNNFAVLYSELYRLTTEYQTFTLEFKPTKSYSAKVSLLLGGQGANTVYIDELSNKKITESEATIDLREYQPYELTNGDFNYGYYSWNKTIDGGTSANFNTTTGKVLVEVTQNSNTDWHLQLSQTGLKFEAGKTYKLQVVASALVNTTIRAEVSDNKGGTSVIALFKEDIALTSTETTFEFVFTPTENVNQGKVALLLGESELTTIELNSVQVVLVA